jgi:hypothetical protein
MAIELVSFADLKNLLDLEDAAITDYPALNALRTSVTSAIEEYLGRYLESKARTEAIYLPSIATQMILLEAIPVSSVSSLTVTISTDTETYTENDDFEITGYGVRLVGAVSNAKVDITYTGGISTVPDALARAALIQTAYEFQNKEHIGAESVSNEGGSVSRPALQLLPEVKRMLFRYKHPLRW